jgi:transposase-like protein
LRISTDAAFSATLGVRHFCRRMGSTIFEMGKIRRKYDIEFKRQLVQEIETGRITPGQAAREHQLSRQVIHYWRTQHRNNALVDRPTHRERHLEAENEKLKAKIGDLVMQMDHLKTWQAWAQQQKNADTSVITAKNWHRFRKPAK